MSRRYENDNWISVEESEKDLSISAIIRRLFLRNVQQALLAHAIQWLGFTIKVHFVVFKSPHAFPPLSSQRRRCRRGQVEMI